MEKKNSVIWTGETTLSWLVLIILLITIGLLGLLSYRILQLQNYMSEFSNHIDEHLTKIIETTAKDQIRYKQFSGEINIDSSPIKGDLNTADLVIVEFTDFECPYCAEATQLINDILSDHSNFALIHKDYPLPNHAFAFTAAVAARCAGEQDKYWGMYDLLFKNQNNLDEDSLKGRAQILGLDAKTFNTCLYNSSPQEKVNEDFKQGLKMKIDGTPTYIVGKITQKSRSIVIDGYVAPMNDLMNVIELTK